MGRQKNHFEETEYWQYTQQRFDAALAFTVAACGITGVATDSDISGAVEQADRLLAKLESTRTKTDEDTAF